MLKLASALVAVILVAAGGTVALATYGGSGHHHNAGHHQYNPKPDCKKKGKKGKRGKFSSFSGWNKHWKWKKKDKHCPKPPDCKDGHWDDDDDDDWWWWWFSTHGSRDRDRDRDECDDDCRGHRSKYSGLTGGRHRGDDDCRRRSAAPGFRARPPIAA